jgi:hypothetical protein
MEQKTMNEANWHLRVPAPMRQAVEAVAAAEDRSISNALRLLVREALVARGRMDQFKTQREP